MATKSKKSKAVKKTVKKITAKSKAKPKLVAKAKTKVKPVMKTAVKVTAAPRKKINLQNFITPLDDRLLIQVIEGERRTPGGLYIPDTAADMSGNQQGFVIAAGRGHRDKKGRVRPMDVKVGVQVIFAQHSGSKIEIQGENIVILRESDVMGIID